MRPRLAVYLKDKQIFWAGLKHFYCLLKWVYYTYGENRRSYFRSSINIKYIGKG